MTLGMMLTVGWVVSQVAGAGSALTLDEAVDIALRNAFAVRIAEAGVERARQNTAAAQGSLGPNVSVNGVYQRFAEPQASIPGFASPRDSKSASASLRVPIDISGTLREGVRVQRGLFEAAVEDRAAQINAVRGQVKDAYFVALQAEELVEVRQRELQAAEERLRNARLRFEAQTLARFDVLRFEAEVRAGEAELIRAQNDVRSSKNALNNVLGRPIATPTQLVPVEGLPEPPRTSDAAVEIAQRTRPEVRAQQRRLGALAAARRAEEGGLKPSLGLDVTYQRAIDPGPFSREQQTTATAQVTLPVFDSGITRARVRAARQSEVEAQAVLEQIQLAVDLDVRQAYVRLENARAQIDVATKQVEVAEEALRLAELRYSEGVGILLDVTDAQATLTAARTGLVNARFEYRAAWAQLERAMGTNPLDVPEGAKEKES